MSLALLLSEASRPPGATVLLGFGFRVAEYDYLYALGKAGSICRDWQAGRIGPAP